MTIIPTRKWIFIGTGITMIFFSSCNAVSELPSTVSNTTLSQQSTIVMQNHPSTNASCNSIEKSSANIRQTICSNSDPISSIPPIDNTSDLDALLQDMSDTSILQKWYAKVIPMGVSVEKGSIETIKEELPITFLRQMNETQYYTVLKLSEKGYLFLYFQKLTDSFIRFRCSAYSEKRLQKADFNQIRMGDSISKVAAIDPTVRFVNRKYDSTISLHLLTDGMIRIEYQKKDSDYFVSDIAYSRERLVSVSSDFPEKYCFDIFPNDLRP